MHSIHSSFIRSGTALVASVLALVGLAPAPATHLQAAASSADTASANASQGRALDALASLPLNFEPRELGGAAAFVGRGQGYNISVGARGASVALLTAGRRAELAFAIDGATGAARLEGETRLPGVMHHYVGGPQAWQASVATFARVLAHDVRPGIDVAYYGDQRQLEYDFIVKPGANPADAGMLVHGADRLQIDRATGDLLVHVSGQVLRQRAPVAYQEIDGVPPAGRERIHAGRHAGPRRLRGRRLRHPACPGDRPGARVLDVVRRGEPGGDPRHEGRRQRLHLCARLQRRTRPASR